MSSHHKQFSSPDELLDQLGPSWPQSTRPLPPSSPPRKSLYFNVFDPQYNIDKPANEEDYEDEDEDEDGFTGGARRPDVVEDDPIEGESGLQNLNI